MAVTRMPPLRGTAEIRIFPPKCRLVRFVLIRGRLGHSIAWALHIAHRLSIKCSSTSSFRTSDWDPEK